MVPRYSRTRRTLADPGDVRGGLPNDQYGRTLNTQEAKAAGYRPEAPPLYGGNLTAPHDWSAFDETFHPNQALAALPVNRIAAPTPAAVGRPSLTPTSPQGGGHDWSAFDSMFHSQPAAVQAPAKIQTVGTPTPGGTPLVTPIDPRYQAPGGPAIGTTKYPTGVDSFDSARTAPVARAVNQSGITVSALQPPTTETVNVQSDPAPTTAPAPAPPPVATTPPALNAQTTTPVVPPPTPSAVPPPVPVAPVPKVSDSAIKDPYPVSITFSRTRKSQGKNDDDEEED